jgi:glycosyltransferase involved in cell wall biosynthesis
MRIAFLTDRYLDPSRIGSWSGTSLFIKRCLEDAGCELVPIACTRESRLAQRWARFLYWRIAHGMRYLRDRDTAMLKHRARRTRQRLRGADAVFSPGTMPLAYLDTNVPTVFWTDASFAGMLDFYPSFTNLAPSSIDEGHALERWVLERCSLAIYSSDWAAHTALASYPIKPNRVAVVPFGANLETTPSREEIEGIIQSRDPACCRLLFVGVDWERKGAEIAVEAAEALTGAGVRVHLDLVGCLPPPNRKLPSYIELHRFVTKTTPEGRQKIESFFRRSHFLILPSRAECFGVVICEANAFAVPCVATNVGGIPSLIMEGRNGKLFDLEASGHEYAAFIAKLVEDPKRYRALALAAFEESRSRLSWQVSGPKIIELLRRRVLCRGPANRKQDSNNDEE